MTLVIDFYIILRRSRSKSIKIILRKVIYSILSLGFLVSCSSGGNDIPELTLSEMIIGEWELYQKNIQQTVTDTNYDSIIIISDTSYILEQQEILDNYEYQLLTFYETGIMKYRIYKDNQGNQFVDGYSDYFITENSKLWIENDNTDPYPIILDDETLIIDVNIVNVFDGITYNTQRRKFFNRID